MPAPLHFRSATLADRDAIVALVTSAYRGDASRAGWTTEADLLDGPRVAPEVLEHDLTRPRSRVVIAERDEQPDAAAAPEPGVLITLRRMVACAHVCDDAGAGYFGMFAVDPTRQGGGVGDAVLRECERIARDDWQLPVMRMTVIDCRLELLEWYERRGYRRTGVFKPFPYGDERFGHPKRSDLRFEVLEKAL
jgi:ribosomal protein S18 acetylase RimI-like enzyme